VLEATRNEKRYESVGGKKSGIIPNTDRARLELEKITRGARSIGEGDFHPSLRYTPESPCPLIPVFSCMGAIPIEEADDKSVCRNKFTI
jgi:hypothetical protein